MRLLGYFVLLCMPFLAWGYDVPQEKQYPPYPEIWGADLTHYVRLQQCETWPSEYKMPNGDIWFFFKTVDNEGHKVPISSRKARWAMHQFFRNIAVDFDDAEWSAIPGDHDNPACGLEIIDKLPYKVVCQITFASGRTIESHDYSNNGSRCRTIDVISDLSLIKRNAKGEVLSEYVVLFIHSAHHLVEDTTGTCDDPFYSGTEPFLKIQTIPMTGSLRSLDDGTFLVRSEGVIVRFDENMKTKYQGQMVTLRDGRKLKSNFFVMPYSVLNKIRTEVLENKNDGATPYYPTVQMYYDKVEDYLFKNQDRLMKEVRK
jgi:hypothetical protein